MKFKCPRIAGSLLTNNHLEALHHMISGYATYLLGACDINLRINRAEIAQFTCGKQWCPTIQENFFNK